MGKRSLRLIRARCKGAARLKRERLQRARNPQPDVLSMASRRFGPGSAAQIRLFLECEKMEPSQKRIRRLLRSGASLTAKTSLGKTPFLLSARSGSPAKAWLWNWMAELSDERATDDHGRGFEILAASAPCRAALAWWRARGGPWGRMDAEGRDAWSHAAESGADGLGEMMRLFPNDIDRASEAIYGLAEVFRRLNERARLNPGAPKATKGSIMSLLVYGPMATGLSELIVNRPELARASHELSGLFEQIGAFEEQLAKLRLAERAAIARAERDDIKAAILAGREVAAKSL